MISAGFTETTLNIILRRETKPSVGLRGTHFAASQEASAASSFAMFLGPAWLPRVKKARRLGGASNLPRAHEHTPGQSEN